MIVFINYKFQNGSNSHRPVCKIIRRKWEEIKWDRKQLLLRMTAVMIPGNLNGTGKLIMIGEFFKGIDRPSAIFNINRIQLIIRFDDKFQFG